MQALQCDPGPPGPDAAYPSAGPRGDAQAGPCYGRGQMLPRRPQRPTRCVLIALALVWILAVAVPLVAPSAAAQGSGDGVPAEGTVEDGWRLIGRRTLGGLSSNPSHTMTLWVDDNFTQPFEEGRSVPFRFDLFHRANGSRVLDGRPLQVYLFLCHAPDDGGVTLARPEPSEACDRGVRQDTETGRSLRLATPGTTNPPVLVPTYFLATNPDTTFTNDGDWRIEVLLPEQEGNVTATFDVRVGPDTISPLQRAFEESGLGVQVMVRIGVFIAYLAAFYTVSRLLLAILHRTALSPARVEPTAVKLADRLIVAGFMFVAVGFSLWMVWQVNVWTVVTALGLLTVALGFGMQNTVANIMGGISLALDKPFVIGDRIKVGDSWGDVMEIGVRSTMIETPKREIVIIPNKLLDEREIWNYTLGHPELRLDVDVGISYDSDWRLAQVLMLEAAQANDEILAYPRPVVHMRKFGDSSVTMQLRAWMAAAKNSRTVESDLLKSIKDAFDEEGVEIPYPYRTLVEKKALPTPRQVTKKDMQRIRFSERGGANMLVLAAGIEPAHRSARLVCRVARKLELNLIVVTVRPQIDAHVRRESDHIFGFYKNVAQAENVHVESHLLEGDLHGAILGMLERETVDLIVIGSGRTNIFGAPTKVSELTRGLRQETDVPILVVPKNLVVPDRTIDHYRRRLERRVADRKRDRDEAQAQGDESEGEDGEETTATAT